MSHREPSPRPARGRHLGLAAITLLLLSAGARAASAGSTFQPFALRTTDGKATTLSDVAGQATLVVFFFPSCRYCSVAYTALQKLHDDYRERGLRLVWVNMLPEQDDRVPAWIEKHAATVPVLVGAREAELRKAYKLRMAPTIYVVGADGEIHHRRAGFKPGDEVEIEKKILAALAVQR